MSKSIEKKIIEEFKDRYNFPQEELFTFLKSFEPNLNKEGFKVKVAGLKKKGIIKTLVIDHFTISYRPDYLPEISEEIFGLAKVIDELFGAVKYCIWDTHWLNEFTKHNQVKQLIIIEIEEDLVESLYLKLNENHKCYLNPDENTIDFNNIESQIPIVVKKLIAKSPMLKRKIKKISINTPKIEKIVADLSYYCAPGALSFIETIMRKQFAFNQNRSFRYIDCLASEQDIKKFLTHVSPPMKYRWTTTKNEKTYALSIQTEEEQVLSSESTGHWRSETGGCVSFEELLNGEWDDWITETFGENALIEAKNTVWYL